MPAKVIRIASRAVGRNTSLSDPFVLGTLPGSGYGVRWCRRSGEVAEGVLQAAKKVVGGLAKDDLAVGFAGVAQHDPEDMGLAPLAVGPHDRGAFAKVDLGLVAGL
jgi:hypothetical protein